MAGSKISALTQTTNVTGEELIPIVIDGQNKTIKVKYVKGANNLTDTYVELADDKSKKYRLKIKNGKAVAVPLEVYTETAPAEGDNARFDGLIINSMYGGGSAIVDTPLSHSYIELYNFRTEPVNLKGLYLWYRAKTGTWQSLALEGIVPSRNSFLIRCGQHNDFYAPCVRYALKEYDMDWDVKLSNQGFSAYLCIGNAVPEDNPVRFTKDAQGNVNWTNGRYIDLLGAGGKLEVETIWAYELRYLKCMDKNTGVRRVDFANSGAKIIGSNALVKGNNEADCMSIDFKTCNIDIYRPRSLADGRWTEFYDKPKQTATSPSMINIMYGENGNNTRTFTFQTPIVDNGMVKYRKQGDSKWESVETSVETISNYDGDTSLHRAIVRNLEFGSYEYQVGTTGCWSDVNSFDVKNYNESNPIRVAWTSDQQS